MASDLGLLSAPKIIHSDAAVGQTHVYLVGLIIPYAFECWAIEFGCKFLKNEGGDLPLLN